jgi:butyryl-CoA dehydrogenase
LGNATLYLDAFGRVALAWIWLKQAIAATSGLESNPTQANGDYYKGKLQAATYFFNWELPQTIEQFRILRRLDRSAFDMQPEWFE